MYHSLRATYQEHTRKIKMERKATCRIGKTRQSTLPSRPSKTSMPSKQRSTRHILMRREPTAMSMPQSTVRTTHATRIRMIWRMMLTKPRPMFPIVCNMVSATVSSGSLATSSRISWKNEPSASMKSPLRRPTMKCSIVSFNTNLHSDKEWWRLQTPSMRRDVLDCDSRTRVRCLLLLSFGLDFIRHYLEDSKKP